MRVSSNMIFDAGVAAINKQTETLMHLQQQVSTGRRVLSPADDPVAAARALEVQQSMDITNQYKAAQGTASDTLGMMDSQLTGASDLMTQIKTLVVQAGNPTLTNSDRVSVTTQLRSCFDQMLGIANATDSSGQYMFAGYKGNTQPYLGTVEKGVTYFGDDGQRSLQVSAAQQMAVSEAGSAIFDRNPVGNASFVTAANANNTGTGTIDTGSVTNFANWQSTSNSGNLKVSFWIDGTGVIGPPNATYYDLVDTTTGNSLYTGTPSTTGVGGTFALTHAYTSGQPITFSGLAAPYNDFGATLSVSGKPSSGDSFTVKRSASQSVFKTLGDLILAVEVPQLPGTNASTTLTNAIRTTLNNLDLAESNILSARTRIGSRMSEADSLKSVNGNLNLQYQQDLSQLQDVDFTKAISDMTKLQTQLQAAQKSFVNVSQLSLFSYIN